MTIKSAIINRTVMLRRPSYEYHLYVNWSPAHGGQQRWDFLTRREAVIFLTQLFIAQDLGNS
jgi:hypothetical protein